MGAEHDGLSLEGLASRLEVLEHENAELRSEVAALRGRDTRSIPTFEQRMSRRALLGKAGVAAVATVAAGTLLNQRRAEAETFPSVLTGYVQAISSDFEHTAISGSTSTTNASVPAIEGINGGAPQGGGGVGPGVLGHSFFGAGVKGVSDSGTGIVGDGKGNDNAGVLGRNQTGTGMWGQSSETGYSAVFGQHKGTAGYGVVGDGTGNGVGVLGRNPSGAGVEGRNSRYGGRFDGSRAQLVLVPRGTSGRPTTGSHVKGEVSMDSAATLFVCTKGGTPGMWRKIPTTAG